MKDKSRKTFTAALLADMVTKGEVALEDPISRFLSEGVTMPSHGGREITLLDLATHRSGLPKNPDNHTPADQQNPDADYTIETMYEFLSSYELRREPGSQFEYSNLGFQLLGHALAQAAGMSYTELHRERILIPFGMTTAGFTLDGERAEWAAQGHRSGSVVPYWTGREARNDSPTPRAVAAGDEWQRIGIEWKDGYWVFLGGLVLLGMLTLGAELRRLSRRRGRRGS
jgi:CubicO group peptidase (beta-lactamase class C family)